MHARGSAVGLLILGDVMLPWFRGESFLMFYNFDSCELALCMTGGEDTKRKCI